MGALHGWPGCLSLARGNAKVGLAEHRDEVDSRWNRANKPPPKRRRPHPTQRQKESATDSFVVDLADWLSSHLTTADQIEAIATRIGNDVTAELDGSFDASSRDARRKTLAESHFWCDMLAALATTLNAVQKQIDKTIDQVPKLVVSAIEPQTTIGQATVRLVAARTWDLVKNIEFVKAAIAALDLSEPLRAIRMLAVMICPAPERHEVVVKHCMNPLIGQHVSSVTKHRLEAALPEEWLT